MRQHTHLAAMMRVVRNHVGQHGCACGPRSRPTVAAKSFDPARRPRQSVRKHFGATRGAFNQSGPGLLLRAASAVERGEEALDAGPIALAICDGYCGRARRWRR